MNRLYLFVLAFSFSFLYYVQSDTEYFTASDGIRLAYDDTGSGAVVLLLHGFINTRKNWNKAVLKQELIDANYRVIAIDLRGNGDSDIPTTESSYANDIEIQDIKQLMDHLKITQYKAIGYSRGSIVLAKLLTKDSRITKAVIGGMGLDFTDPNWDRRIAFANAFRDASSRTEMTIGAVNYAKSIGRDTMSLSYQQIHQPVTSIAELEKIEIPILVISGDEDHDNGEPSALADKLPQSQLVIIKGDHNNSYKSDAFANEVMLFLR